MKTIEESLKYLYEDGKLQCQGIMCKYDKCPLNNICSTSLIENVEKDISKTIKGKEIKIANHFKKVRADKKVRVGKK